MKLKNIKSYQMVSICQNRDCNISCPCFMEKPFKYKLNKNACFTHCKLNTNYRKAFPEEMVNVWSYCANTQCSAYGNCDLMFNCPLFKPTSEKPKPKKRTQPLTTEDNEQEAVIEYCELKHIIAVHIPNEAKRSVAYGAKMKRMGLRKGFPDIFIPTARKGFYGLFIELKRDKKSRTSPEQLGWITYLNKQGYKAMVCYGATEAIEEIEKYFKE